MVQEPRGLILYVVVNGKCTIMDLIALPRAGRGVGFFFFFLHLIKRGKAKTQSSSISKGVRNTKYICTVNTYILIWANPVNINDV